MDQLKHMRLFVAIAEGGSLTAAADKLETSLPSVVRGLAALETHLGVRLFNRSTRRIALTDEGRRYLIDSRHVLAAVQEAEAAVRADMSEPAGHLRITAPVLFGQMYVAPAVNAFIKRYEAVSVDLVLLDRVVNLVEEGFDVAIRIGALSDSSLVAQPLGMVRQVVVASPAYLACRGVPAHPRELRGAECISLVGSSMPHWAFIDGGRRVTVAVQGRLCFNHVAPAVAACRDGLGFGSFLSYQVAPDVARGALEIVLAEHELPARPISVLYPHARLLPARTRAFVTAMREALSGFSM
ncbi:LysR family transcriptional regulator [Cognatazoarcus halotolerans]|uniref:LysR family transcriptional regulator n=1 Tax=Cognatazoarcus halotolerans TaxID=2686016 RepID=UPI001358D244|nr:LysR family transcriptional regulator [Cognatazoarcus halotolerans]MCP5309146.1 LysR family transcriptional regulator [Zoogloeaceae bacterium]